MNTSGDSPRDELNRELTRELAAFDVAGLRRATDDGARNERGADFVSNDYLGLNRDPRVAAAAAEAAREFGAGAGAARLLGGGALHGAVERSLAEWLGAESALFFPTGFQANLGVLGALADRRDAIVSDELNHASIIDACRLTRSRVTVFRHADVADLARALESTRDARRRIVVTESVFGMDGDLAPLAAIHDTCLRHGALLLIDDAHAIGVLGAEGRGAWSADVGNGRALLGRVVTGGKALGVAGGFFAGDAAVRETLLHRARAFVFTTAAPPSIAGALLKAIEIVRTADLARAWVRQSARRVALALGLREPAAAIVPLVIGDNAAAVAASAKCRAAGLDVRAVRPPTVPEGTARLRISLHAHNTDQEIERLIEVLRPFAAMASIAEKSSGSAAARVPDAEQGPLAREVFIAGTDTGVGKTVASALIVRLLARRGPVRYWKPVQTGDECDTAAVIALAGLGRDESIEPMHRFALPASPHAAAEAERATIDETKLDRKLDELLKAAPAGARIVVELAGGLIVPYRLGFDQGDWVAKRRPALVLVARSGLGTLNHTGLSLEALARRGVRPSLVLLVGEPHATNVATLRALHPALRFVEVPPFDPLDRDAIERFAAAHSAVLEDLP